MVWPDGYVKKSRFEVHTTEDLGPMDLMGEVPQQGQWKTVWNCLGVQISEIRARSHSPSWLVCQVQAAGPVCVGPRLDLFNDAILDHLIPDLLPFY